MDKKELKPDDDTLTKAFRAVRIHAGETTLVTDLTGDIDRIFEVPILDTIDIPQNAINITPAIEEPLP